MPAVEHALRQPRGRGLARKTSPTDPASDKRARHHTDGVEARATFRINSPSRPTGSPQRAKLLRTGVRFDPLLPLDAWKALGAKIAAHSDATSWWLGDWLAFGQMKYGRRYKEAIALTGLEYQTLRNYAVVARRFELSRRRDNLSFQHHAEICAMTNDEQTFWLDLASEHHWTRSELRFRVRAATTARDCPSTPRTMLRLTPAPERERLWREAAELGDLALDVWMVQALDEAARDAIDSPAQPRAPDMLLSPRTAGSGE
jgi:hypothetical protein